MAWIRVIAAAAIAVACVVSAGESPAAPGKQAAASPAKENAAALAAETPEQKALRAELAAMKDTRIVFNANLNPGGRNAIFIMRPDGSDMKKLSPDSTDDTYPHISFDGRKLVFQRREVLSAEELKKLPFDPAWPFSREGRASPGKPEDFVWVCDLDGSNARRVAHGSHPHWAPNGKALVYAFHWLYGRKYKTAILDLEKNSEKAVVPMDWKVSEGYSAFSPDGKWLLLSYGFTVCPYIRVNETCTDRAADTMWVRSPLACQCNAEFSPDGKWVLYVTDTFKDAGSWLMYAPFEPGNTSIKGQDLPLRHEKKSVNYFPDFSPCGKYIVYSHGESQEGVKSWLLESKQDLYITRFPGCEAAVRVTWTDAACQHPAWRKIAE